MAEPHGTDHRLEGHAGEHAGGFRSGGHRRGHHDRGHHAHMVADFRRRFWVSLALTVPVLALAPLIQRLLGLDDLLAFPGDRFVQFGFGHGRLARPGEARRADTGGSPSLAE